MGSLADLLDARAKAVEERWEAQVRKDAPHPVDSGPELRDHVPDLLRELTTALRGGRPPRFSRYAREHGRQRYRLGFDLQTLVWEYGLLRSVLFDLIEESACPVSHAELRILADFLSTSVAEGVAEHVQQHAQEERDRLEAQVRHSRLVSEIARAVGGIADRRRMLERCAQLLIDQLPGCQVSVHLLEPEGGEAPLEVVAPAPAPGGEHDGKVGVDLPLKAGARVLGALTLHAREPLPGEALVALEQAADLIALGCERLSVEKQRQRLLTRAEEALAEAEFERQRLRTLFLTAPVAICTLEGPAHTFTFANAAYRALVGGRDVEGRPLLEALPEMRAQAFPALLDRVMSTGETVVGNETPVHLVEAGGPRTLSVNFVYAPLRGPAGRVEGVLVTASDVTELAEARAAAEAANAELNAIFRSLPDAVYVGGPAGIGRANQAALDMLGYRDMAELDKSVATLAEEIQTRRADTGEPVSAEDQAFSRALRGHPDVQEVVVRNRRTGEDRVVRSACAPILVGGEVVGAVAINTDVTERQRAEELVRERADFEKQLIGIVSHDLRNPLSAILLGAASLLRGEGLDERSTRLAVRIQTSAERAVRMIRDLLDFTQSRLGGGIPISRRPTDLQAAVWEVMEEVGATHPDREVRVNALGDGQGEWDPDRLAQVLQNLLTNALRYSPPGTPVEVRTRDEGEVVSIEVHNRGDPIPPERLGRLFEPFQRGTGPDPSTRSVGLGLYIVKQLVAAHGGTVSARSSAEEGTTFRVRLPRAAVRRLPEEQEAPPPTLH